MFLAFVLETKSESEANSQKTSNRRVEGSGRQAGYPQVPKFGDYRISSIGGGSTESHQRWARFALTCFPCPIPCQQRVKKANRSNVDTTQVSSSSLDCTEISQLADQGMLFVGCDMGMSSSRWFQWQDRGISDKATLLRWIEAGNSLVTVAKRGHSFVIDLDDPTECERRGFKREWLDGYCSVDTPSGGEHHHGLHDATTEALGNLIVVYREKGNTKSGKILELKLHNQSVAAPTAYRAEVVEKGKLKKCAGIYEPRSLGARMRQGIDPEMLAWLEENGEFSTPHEKSGATRIDFHPLFEMERFLERHDCTEDQSGVVGGALHVVVESCPICGKEARNSTVAAGITKFIFGGHSFGFVCHACGINTKQGLEEKLAELIEDFEPWNEFIYEYDDLELLLDTFGAQEAEDFVESAERHLETTGSWSQIANELDDLRRGKEQHIKDGEIKEKALPRHIADERTLHFVKDAFEKRGKGKFFFDAYPYIYLPEERQVVRFQDDAEAHQLLGKMRLRIKQHDTDLVRENLRAHIMEFGEPTRVEKLGCMRGEAIYVNNGRGGMFKITTESISEVANGTDGVLMHAPDLKPFPRLDEAKLEEIRNKLNGIGGKVTDSLLCQHLNAHFEEGGSLLQPQYQQLVIMRFLTLFIGNSLNLRPIMMALGEQNSGKSTLWEKIMWLLYGTDYQSSALPSKRRDFVAAMTNNAINVFDNIDSVNFDNPRSDYPEYIDLMCKAATGGTVPIAELYKTNVQKMYDLRCDQFLTARVNPFPSHRSDLSRRTLFFPVRMPSPLEYRTTEEIKTALEHDADEIKLEILVRLQNVLRALVANKKSYPAVSQMHSFENFTMRIADHEGWADEMQDIWEGYMGDYRERITEDSPLVEYVRRWIGMTTKTNAGRWARAGEIYADLEETYGVSFTRMWKSSAVFGRKIRENLTALRVLGIDTKKPQGNQHYKFDPSSEQMERCRDAWNDSAPHHLLGDEARGITDPKDVYD